MTLVLIQTLSETKQLHSQTKFILLCESNTNHHQHQSTLEFI